MHYHATVSSTFKIALISNPICQSPRYLLYSSICPSLFRIQNKIHYHATVSRTFKVTLISYPICLSPRYLCIHPSVRLSTGFKPKRLNALPCHCFVQVQSHSHFFSCLSIHTISLVLIRLFVYLLDSNLDALLLSRTRSKSLSFLILFFRLSSGYISTHPSISLSSESRPRSPCKSFSLAYVLFIYLSTGHESLR